MTPLERLQAYAESIGITERFEGPDALRLTAQQIAYHRLYDILGAGERERYAPLIGKMVELYFSKKGKVVANVTMWLIDLARRG